MIWDLGFLNLRWYYLLLHLTVPDNYTTGSLFVSLVRPRPSPPHKPQTNIFGKQSSASTGAWMLPGLIRSDCPHHPLISLHFHLVLYVLSFMCWWWFYLIRY